jgi:signal transduction histidine kinase
LHAIGFATGVVVNDIVPPVYIAFALVFLGLFAASVLRGSRHRLPHDRSVNLAGAGALQAATACLFVALLPVVGRSALVLATAFMLGSYTAMYLRVRSWHSTLSRQWLVWTFTLVGALCVLNGVLVALQVSIPLRIVYQCLLANGLLAFVLRELNHAPSEAGSSQLQMMRWSVVAMMLLIIFWGWVVYQQHAYSGVVIFQTNFSEPWLAFVLRLFVTACLVLAHVSANGYAMEHLTNLRIKSLTELTKVEAENMLLAKILHEKNELLKAVSFSVRSQNLPVIMSSLNHEINQPLGAIRLNADYLMAEFDSMEPVERQRVLAHLVKCSESVSSVLKSFRRFFESAVDQQTVDMTGLLTDLMRALRTDFLHKAVQVVFEPGEPMYAYGDPVQFESAVTGVIDHISGPGYPGSKQLLVDCIGTDTLVLVRVLSMDGSLKKDEFQKMFDRSTKGGSGSFSSGLWLSRAIVEHHGGAMSVCNVNGMSGISLQLPLLKDVK